MDVARLQSLVQTVIADYESSKVIALLTSLESAFTASVQSPGPETAKVFDAARDEFLNAARQMTTRQLPPSKLGMLEQLHRPSWRRLTRPHRQNISVGYQSGHRRRRSPRRSTAHGDISRDAHHDPHRATATRHSG